jgi:hypothetical protein
MQKQPFDYDQASATTQDDLVSLLNDDLERQCLASIPCVVYSQIREVAQYINNAGQVDYLGDVPRKALNPATIATEAEEVLLVDLDVENETVTSDNVSINANRRANMPLPNTSATSWGKSRIIRSLWQVPQTWKSPLESD